MKNRNTLFNANHLALMHGLSINPTPTRTVHAEADRRLAHHQEKTRRTSRRRPPWRLWLLPLFAKMF